MKYNKIEEFYSRFSKGEIVIIFDEKRENEADFFCLGEFITPEKVNFFLTEGKGMITVPCTPEILENLNIPKITDINECPHVTNYALPIDAKKNVTTGVGADDRSVLIKLLANKHATPEDFIRPGHTTPLIAQDPNTRFGHTECAVEMAKKVNKYPVIAICEILNKNGITALVEEVFEIAKKYNLAIIDLETIKKDILS
jgi:3,4-dihydroxy 2-butanone 4-phosphate synthase/GTP cyclohydrolase II